MKLDVIFRSSLLSLVAGARFGYFPSGSGYQLVGSSFGLPGTNATFDYVIIGGGTAGLTVANRLSAAGSSVAVIEAGSFYEISNSNLSQIPAYAQAPDYQPLVDWSLVAEPQPQLGGRALEYPQGKCFGGGSARNVLAYHRPTVGSFQEWADHAGDSTYEYSNVLPFYRRSAHFTPPNYKKRGGGGPVVYNESGFDSSGGPLQVSYPNYYAPVSDFSKKAFASLGIEAVPGFNTGQLLGYAEFTTTTDPTAQTRSSAETSFLQEAVGIAGIQFYQLSMAEQILFDDKNVAKGVKVSTAGASYVLSAAREIILSAGAFRSPQMLMLSGIGPAATLQSNSIAPVSVLDGVGQNLWDQPFFGVTYKVNVTTQDELSQNTSYAAESAEAYLLQQKGPLTIAGAQIVAFEKLPDRLRGALGQQARDDLSSFPSDWPELEILEALSSAGLTEEPGNHITIFTAILTPTSRGTVTINSTSAYDNPIVSPNWLLSKTDQEVAVQAVIRAREIAQATAIVVGDEVTPGPQVQSDEDILKYVKEKLTTIHHASATCAMGKSGDPNAVVDSRGRVFGVKGLRVIDASAFPFLPPGHPQSTVYMLAEKLAQDIIDGNDS